MLHGEAAIDGLQIDRMGEAGPLRLAAAGADDAYAYKATFTALAAGRAALLKGAECELYSLSLEGHAQSEAERAHCPDEVYPCSTFKPPAGGWAGGGGKAGLLERMVGGARA